MDSEGQKLLHDIDKRLAVVEILMIRNSASLDKIQKEMDTLKIRVAGTASVVSIIVAAAMKLLLH